MNYLNHAEVVLRELPERRHAAERLLHTCASAPHCRSGLDQTLNGPPSALAEKLTRLLGMPVTFGQGVREEMY